MIDFSYSRCLAETHSKKGQAGLSALVVLSRQVRNIEVICNEIVENFHQFEAH